MYFVTICTIRHTRRRRAPTGNIRSDDARLADLRGTRGVPRKDNNNNHDNANSSNDNSNSPSHGNGDNNSNNNNSSHSHSSNRGAKGVPRKEV